MTRVFNFSAGPAMLPEAVLRRAQAELLDWKGSGMSVMEVSHRGADFIDCAANAEAALRRLLRVPENYRVLFTAGGATALFSSVQLMIGASVSTVRRMEKGDVRVPIHFFARAFHVFGQIQALENVLDTPNDDIGLMLLDEQLPKRVRSKPDTSGAL